MEITLFVQFLTISIKNSYNNVSREGFSKEFLILAHSLSFHQAALGSAHQSNNRQEQEELQKIGNVMVQLVKEEKIDPLVKRTISCKGEITTSKELPFSEKLLYSF
ncbi:hypothetical protein [Priestia megaterium]|uniref:hypothetical protein n=1 Tax=Priestia megaterium TaxID=1404 RepID=UPI001FB1B6E8|nr:hypothetical protein [Priestia megaterium]